MFGVCERVLALSDLAVEFTSREAVKHVNMTRYALWVPVYRARHKPLEVPGTPPLGVRRGHAACGYSSACCLYLISLLLTPYPALIQQRKHKVGGADKGQGVPTRRFYTRLAVCTPCHSVTPICLYAASVPAT